MPLGGSFTCGRWRRCASSPANSLFLDGYLNGKGGQRQRVYAMIRDAGYSIVSDASTVEGLAAADSPAGPSRPSGKPSGAHEELSTLTIRGERAVLKEPAELRPARRTVAT